MLKANTDTHTIFAEASLCNPSELVSETDIFIESSDLRNSIRLYALFSSMFWRMPIRKQWEEMLATGNLSVDWKL